MWAHDAREVIDETQKNIKEKNIDTHLETTLPEVEKHIKKICGTIGDRVWCWCYFGLVRRLSWSVI